MRNTIELPAGEVEQRLARTTTAVQDAGLGGLVGYGDCLRAANVSYFTDFRPLDGVSDIAMAALLLPAEGDPRLFVGGGCVAWAADVTRFEVQPLSALADAVAAWARQDQGPLGLAGGSFVPAVLRDEITAALGGVPLVPTDVLAQVKATKSAWEITMLRRAAELTDLAMAAIRDELASGRRRTERELARCADAAMITAGADATGYRSMVQAGRRSAFSLALPTDREVQPGDLVMTDIGARYGGYVADGGRGFSYGAVSADKDRIIEASVQAVETGLAHVRPGITADELNQTIQRVLVEQGYEAHSGEARGHGTGHGTGMDPEEELPWIGPGNPTVLAPDMVFTLKATITVPEVGGLRTERIVRVTDDGCEALDRFPMRLKW